MKLKSIFCGVAAAALLSACSSDEPAVNNGGGVTPKATGYMSVAVNLPTQPAGSRANDYFDDGTSDEYAVNNAMLLLFTGTSEQDAKFHSAYDLDIKDDTPEYGGGNQGTTPGQPDGNITSSYRKTIEVKGVQDNANLFGLVLVNYNGLVTKTNGEGGYLTAVSFGTGKNLTYPKAAAEGTPAVEGTSFSTLLGWTTDYAFHTTDNGFFMANAPVSTKQGGFVNPSPADVQTLVYIGVAENVLRPTEAEANESPAASFFVERAVAKVTLSHSVTTGPNKLVVDNVRWAIDNTEPSSYIVRNVESTDYVLNTYMGYKSNVPTVVNGYRFAGYTPIGQTSIQPFTQLFRTYWAVDPNGTLTTVYNKPVSGVLQEADPVTFGNEKYDDDKLRPQYCHENTFSVADMTHENTTRVILEVTYKSTNDDADKDGSLYTVNGLLYDKLASAQSHGVKAMLPLVAQAIKKVLPTDKAYELNITTENITDYATIKWVPTTDGKLIIGSVEFTDNEDYTGDPSIIQREIDNVNADNAINNYKGGVSYYAVYIKHFGDDLTPWEGGDDNQLEISTVYGTGETANQNYLGRYGMVRNNWYDLSISSFKKLGEPAVGNLTLDNTPDDVNEVSKFLSFRINILAWAKRVQNIEL